MARRARVIGGVISLLHMFPFITEIFYKPLNSTPYHACGGSLLTYTWVLTAAHCHNYNNKDIQYYIGAGYSDGSYTVLKNGFIKLKNGQLRRASLFIPHEKYLHDKNDKIFDNDIALYKTDKPFIKDDFKISLVKLPTQENLIDVSDRYKACFMAGWGRNEPNNSLEWTNKNNGTFFIKWNTSIKRNRNLVYVILPPISEKACKNIYDPGTGIDFSDITKNQMCTLYYPGRKCFCKGDSGGPLICGTRQYGIASWTYTCGQPRLGVDVFTRVDKYLDWISTTIDNASRKYKLRNRFKNFEYSSDEEGTSEYYGLLYEEMIMDNIENNKDRFNLNYILYLYILTFVHYVIVKILTYLLSFFVKICCECL